MKFMLCDDHKDTVFMYDEEEDRWYYQMISSGYVYCYDSSVNTAVMMDCFHLYEIPLMTYRIKENRL